MPGKTILETPQARAFVDTRRKINKANNIKKELGL